MNITREDVLRVAELANLELTEAEIATYGPQLASILSFCEKLNELDTASVEPLAQVLETAQAPEIAQVLETGRPATQSADDVTARQNLRPDEPRDAMVIAEVIRRAPEAVEAPTPYFRVPKVIDR
ncbi:MAG TPA: Asp-tRNA(Asn)/Glu-tRNA(Gln) amidotransferase subunit GatC [Candidatus Acidoferrales bacterium]|nr:Asp-tRNA(Asn)/Glu-tRNA(Gln) amidotransferase subunit GatC [Candidatus Acidoferrales bacterium]